jgi:hypothetical protein
MKDSVKLLVILMIFWSLLVVLCNFIGQAFAISDDRNSLKNAKSNVEAESINSILPETEPSNFVPDNTRQVDLIYIGRGIALKDDESHRLFVSVQKVRYIDPMIARRLMSSNQSIEELKEAINEQNGEIAYSGDLKLDEDPYKLVNINVFQSQDNLALEADVADLPYIYADNTMPIVGHLSFTVPENEITEASMGKLTMKAGRYSETYQVLLSMPTNPDAPVQVP